MLLRVSVGGFQIARRAQLGIFNSSTRPAPAAELNINFRSLLVVFLSKIQRDIGGTLMSYLFRIINFSRSEPDNPHT